MPISGEQLQWSLKSLLISQLPIQITFPLLSVTVEIDERFYAKEVFLKNSGGFQVSLLFLHLGQLHPKANEANTFRRKD